ncbi:hypothetical protein [Candidatus Villigracilis proximus]|uniref:hypothetical protein n=1 Tax=Candidatus Villigracilis proximus TaxID=3140683 RepID=UPI0031E656B6
MSSKADFIIKNARIFTSDETNPQAEAVAVKGNRIVFVGTNDGASEFQGESNPRDRRRRPHRDPGLYRSALPFIVGLDLDRKRATLRSQEYG